MPGRAGAPAPNKRQASLFFWSVIMPAMIRSRAWFPSSFHSPLFSSPSAFVPSSDTNENESAPRRRVAVAFDQKESSNFGRISVATPDLLPTNADQSKDSIRRFKVEEEDLQDKSKPPIVPPRFHPELFSTVPAFIPSNNPNSSAVIGSKTLTQVNSLGEFFTNAFSDTSRRSELVRGNVEKMRRSEV